MEIDPDVDGVTAWAEPALPVSPNADSSAPFIRPLPTPDLPGHLGIVLREVAMGLGSHRSYHPQLRPVLRQMGLITKGSGPTRPAMLTDAGWAFFPAKYRP